MISYQVIAPFYLKYKKSKGGNKNVTPLKLYLIDKLIKRDIYANIYL